MLPTFTHGTLYRESADLDRFEQELRAGLSAVGAEATIVGFYTADVWHLAPILAIAADAPNTTFVVNLMRAHALIRAGSKDRPSAGLRLLAECLRVAKHTNVRICLDTAAGVEELASATAEWVPVWPMAMVADPRRLEAAGRRGRPYPPHIVAPIQAQVVKGFPLLVELAERLSDDLKSGQIAFTARFAPQPGGQRLDALADRFRVAGGRLLAEHLDDAGFENLVGSAHVVVIPYRRGTFRTRTSAVVLDAFAAGKPVVATRGTWAGDLVEEYGVGETFDDGDVDSLMTGIMRVLDNIDNEAVQVLALSDRDRRRPPPRRRRSLPHHRCRGRSSTSGSGSYGRPACPRRCRGGGPPDSGRYRR